MPRQLPITTRTTLEPGGHVRRSLRVFCPQQFASVSLDRCRECGHGGVPDPRNACDPSPSVLCAVAEATSPLGEPSAGMALARHTICIRADVSLNAVDHVALGALGDCGTPVVDAELRFVGVVTVTDLRTVEGAGRALSRVEDVTQRSHLVVREESPVREVLETMAHAHLRRLPVVTSEGIVVGVIDDLEALRSYARFSALITHRAR